MKIKNDELTKPASGYSDSESDRLITVAGQRRTYTGLSPWGLVAAPHQNSLVDRILPEAGIFNPALTGKGRW